MASAPPTAAAKHAIVVRSMFTHGSRRVSIAADVTACWYWPRRASLAPDSSATRSQMRRAARSLAIDGNCSAVTAKRNSSAGQRVVDGQTAVGERAEVGDADRGGDAEFLRVGGAGIVVDGGVDGGQVHAAELLALLSQAEQDVEVGLGAGAGPGADRVGAERAAQLGRLDAALLSHAEQSLRCFAGLGAGVENDGREVEVHALERGG